ncbi:hypothetical protein GLAREA_10119 [Glarea lozoyensis ATCC 20868]|uniref:Vacuolar protein sorting-associated protein 51 homolog n=1 Tax=Glarea lozoyensis (strain ATCC 20868 / MF5171) TaxID=1116229 RepID=S3D9K8_GLAL2|nr:uncharacterized protein GLAREA_10119 [Glarea lozoyensis ATCC 20868]EPE34425.1 hypothetical protein GLAREA_10119 [Glarea lozoyensis ATCC 20868]
MSTIAPQRDPSTTGRRIPLLSTPTSSTRPSTDLPRPLSPSPAPKRNRAALRSYYNLQSSADTQSETSSIHSPHEPSDSPLDRADFDGEAYVRKVLEEQSLEEVLRTYNGVLMDIRALDAERKALVYDNYSKLIAATETIRRMRGSGVEMGGLDREVRGVWERAGALRGVWGTGEGDGVKGRRREVVRRVLETPERVRVLVGSGREEEGRKLWERTRRVLERWRERGVGGVEVSECIEDGEAAVRGEGPGERSWVNVRRDES